MAEFMTYVWCVEKLHSIWSRCTPGLFNTNLKKLGIRHIYHDCDRDFELRRRVRGAQSNIKMISTSAQKTYRFGYGENLVEAMSRGCEVKVLLATTHSDYVNDLHDLQRYPPNGLPVGEHILNDEIIGFEAYFKNNSTSATEGRMTIGHYRTHFRANMTIIDDRFGFYMPTLPPTSSKKTLCLELIEGPVLNDCRNHFDAIVRAGTPWVVI